MLQARNRKLGIIAAVAAVAVALLLWAGFRTPGASVPGGRRVVHLAIPSNGAGFLPAYVAKDQHFYEKQGLDVREDVMDPNITVSALIGSGVDIAYVDSTQLLFAIEKHANVVAVGLSTDKQPYSLISAPSITTVAELKGKKVSVASQIDIYTQVIKRILSKAGLDPDKDVQWIYGGNQTRRLAAMMGGVIDAGLVSPPLDGRLTKQGYHVLAFTPDVYPNLTLSVQSVRRDWAQQQGDTLRRFLRAQAEAVAWLDDPANKARVIQIIIDNTAATPADADATYQYYAGKKIWTDSCIHQPGLINVVKIMREMQELKTITVDDVPSFTSNQWCPA